MKQKKVRCVKCKEIVERKNAVEEVTGAMYCKDCYCGREKRKSW
jgi:formylmethanofuran dehydrogenase subunit E